MQTWRASIVGLGDSADLRGESEVNQPAGADELTATIEMRNDTPGSTRPWHVHFGSCGTGGAIVGSDTDYPRLTVDADGRASASVDIEESLDPGAPYHVNVHRADDDLGTIIACGNLTSASRRLDAGVSPGLDAGLY